MIYYTHREIVHKLKKINKNDRKEVILITK